jgi:lipid-binding SYLF domain-containing protein
MQRVFPIVCAVAALLASSWAYGDSYTDAVTAFKEAGESGAFFHRSYGYAIFPTVGEGAFVVGGALGKGRVYVHGRHVGDSTMGEVTVGFQAGGKVYSEIIFFEDKRALQEFESGNLEISAGASAVAITAAAGASASTAGVQANASGSQNNATTVGRYEKGMAVFTVAKGGLMYAAAIGGQKFSYRARGVSR